MTLRVSDIVPFSEARSRLSELIVEVMAGAQKVITKNGAAVAALIKAEELDRFNDLQRAQAAASNASSTALPSGAGTTLTEMIRAGSINFDQVVERLLMRGYLIEGDGSPLPPRLPDTSAEEFHRLVDALLPGSDILIEFACMSTAEGSEDGAVVRGWFNRALRDADEIDQLLIEFNQAGKVGLS